MRPAGAELGGGLARRARRVKDCRPTAEFSLAEQPPLGYTFLVWSSRGPRFGVGGRTMSFNLLDAKWIPVLWTDGTPDRVDILTAVTEAANIREIAASSPLDTVSLYRFLLAVRAWCADANGYPRCDYLQEHKDRFELLGEHDGFYQEYQEDTPRPATDLLPELPTASNVAHFRHTRDRREGLCPACCALGLVRLSAFATHSAHPPYPGGKPSGINGRTPVYAIPWGATLEQTLRMNGATRGIGDRPGWVNDEPPQAHEIGPLAALTWRPRRVWLERPKRDQPAERCAYCGGAERLIHSIAFLPGWPRPFAKESWSDDPHLLLGVVLPGPSDKGDQHSRIWRKIYRALLEAFLADAPTSQQKHLVRCVQAGGQEGAVTVPCFGPAANQALYQDGTTIRWRVPRGGMNRNRARRALDEMEWVERINTRAIVAKAVPRHAMKRPEIKSAVVQTVVHAEPNLRIRFEQFVEDLARNEADSSQWRCDGKAILWELVREVLRVVGGASPFRKGEQEGRAWAILKGK